MNELTRREALRLAAMAVTSSVCSGSAADAESSVASTKSSKEGASASSIFYELPFGSVRPEGWIQQQLRKQADGITGHLTGLYPPFKGIAWEADESSSNASWVPWEVRAYWCDGALRCGVLLGDDHLTQQAMRLLNFTFDGARSNGYLGPTFLKDPGNYHRWPHTVFFRAAAAWFDSSGDSKIVERLSHHYLGQSYSFTGAREHTNIEAMLWTYAKTGDPKLLHLAERTWDLSQAEIAKQPRNFDLTEQGMLCAGPVRKMHGVSYAEHSKLPAILFLANGDNSRLAISISAHRKIAEHHMLVDGGPSSSEFLSTVTARDAHETCDLIDYPWDWGYLMAATRDGAYGDMIEKATFNALPGSIRKDWRALQYYSSPNQVLATSHSDHLAVLKGTELPTIKNYRYLQRMSYRPSPGYNVVCCPANLNRALPNFVARMWMADSRAHGLAATLYGPSKVTANVGVRNQPITIVEETRYPYSDAIHLRFSMSEVIHFPLHLRIPAWCSRASVNLNGNDLPIPPLQSGFITIDRAWASGDSILLRLPMSVTTSVWPEDGLAVERGPLVYAYPIPQTWNEVEDERSSAQFPAYDLTPSGPWNYSLLSDFDSTFDESHASKDQDPWSVPTSTIKVKSRQIPDWKTLHTSVADESVTFTPRLPDAAALPTMLSGPMQEITLVPFGNTELRIAVFPHLKTDPGKMPGD